MLYKLIHLKIYIMGFTPEFNLVKQQIVEKDILIYHMHAIHKWLNTFDMVLISLLSLISGHMEQLHVSLPEIVIHTHISSQHETNDFWGDPRMQNSCDYSFRLKKNMEIHPPDWHAGMWYLLRYMKSNLMSCY